MMWAVLQRERGAAYRGRWLPSLRSATLLTYSVVLATLNRL